MGITKSKPKQHLPQDRAIFELKSQRDQITKYQVQLNAIVERELEIVRQCLVKGDKNKAILALRKKKYQEQLIERSGQQLLQIEEMTLSIEYAVLETQILAGLQKGNETLKEIHQQCSIDQVDRIMQDTMEAIQYQQEIEAKLSNQLTETDELSVLQELDSMIQEQQEHQIKFPAVPTGLLPDTSQPQKNTTNQVPITASSPVLNNPLPS